jgi:hypothetical protein
MDMKRHMLMCPFMCMLYSRIKFEISINNDELLKTIWEHMKEIKRGQGGRKRYYYIDKLLSHLPLFLVFFLTAISFFFPPLHGHEMLYSKIKFEIDINNNELLETI